MSHIKHGLHALHHATENEGVKGAVTGAIGTASTAAGLLALGGLALTPVGWGVLATAGAIAGGSGLLKKLRGH